MSVASDVDVKRQIIFNVISSTLRSSYLPSILLSVLMATTIISISCTSLLATAKNTNDSGVQTTTVSSSMYFNDDSNTKGQSPSLSLPISNKTLSIYGNIDLTNSSIRLEPFMILPGSKYTALPSNSSFSINLLDGEGKNLARYPFNPKISTYLPENNHHIMALLSEAVPYNSATKQIVISKDGAELASRYVSAHTPEVKLIFPNGDETFKGKFTVRWQGSDLDSDHLTYSLLYSADNGYTWQAIANNINESQLTTNVNELPGSTTALFRIIASDGVNTAMDDSDHTFIIIPDRSIH